jgi:ribosome-associated translation inhibitor RaiA
MYDEYVIMLQILETKKVKGLDVASKVKVYQMSTDESLNPLEAITRTAEKDGLYEALDLAEVWLKRSMAKVKSKA